MPTYQGGCHCGRVRFEVTTDLEKVIDCNCSICRKKGFLHLIVPPEQFRLLSSPDAVALYEFNTKTAKHYFCPVCGIHSYYIPRSHPDMIDINVRCLEGIDVGSLAIQSFNGQEWERERHTLDD
ncbi:MAG: GFA family protein [Deltaproteobacteria bacterium]|nr:GFA family protein [Deltaproteobacteria bacterium]